MTEQPFSIGSTFTLPWGTPIKVLFAYWLYGKWWYNVAFYHGRHKKVMTVEHFNLHWYTQQPQ